MSFEDFLTTPGTLVRAGTLTDRYGDEALDWDTPAHEIDVLGWFVDISRSEVIDGRDALVSGWLYFLPAGTDVLGRDRVVIAGTTYEVDGPPSSAATPAGEHHVEARLRLVEG